MSFIEYAEAYETDLSKLDTVQIAAMWIVSGAAARSDINNLCQGLCWPSLGQGRIEHTLFMFYNIPHGDAPSCICYMPPQTVGDRNDYNLLSAHNMDMPFTRFEYYWRSFLALHFDEVMHYPTFVSSICVVVVIVVVNFWFKHYLF